MKLTFDQNKKSPAAMSADDVRQVPPVAAKPAAPRGRRCLLVAVVVAALAVSAAAAALKMLYGGADIINEAPNVLETGASPAVDDILVLNDHKEPKAKTHTSFSAEKHFRHDHEKPKHPPMRVSHKALTYHMVDTEACITHMLSSNGPRVGHMIPGAARITSVQPLHHDLSVNCEKGLNFGHLENEVFVSDGCKGRFRICFVTEKNIKGHVRYGAKRQRKGHATNIKLHGISNSKIDGKQLDKQHAKPFDGPHLKGVQTGDRIMKLHHQEVRQSASGPPHREPGHQVGGHHRGRPSQDELAGSMKLFERHHSHHDGSGKHQRRRRSVKQSLKTNRIR